MGWFYVAILLVVVAAFWRVRRKGSRNMLSPSELGEVLGRSRDATNLPPSPSGEGKRAQPHREPQENE